MRELVTPSVGYGGAQSSGASPTQGSFGFGHGDRGSGYGGASWFSFPRLFPRLTGEVREREVSSIASVGLSGTNFSLLHASCVFTTLEMIISVTHN